MEMHRTTEPFSTTRFPFLYSGPTMLLRRLPVRLRRRRLPAPNRTDRPRLVSIPEYTYRRHSYTFRRERANGKQNQRKSCGSVFAGLASGLHATKPSSSKSSGLTLEESVLEREKKSRPTTTYLFNQKQITRAFRLADVCVCGWWK